MNKTGIGYLDFTWNPVTGCTYGCPECWARATAARMAMNPKLSTELRECYRTFTPTLHPERLGEPAKLKRPSVVGVGFMGDLCEEAFKKWRKGQPSMVYEVLKAAATSPQHTYVFLTKRAARLAEICENYRASAEIPLNWYMGVTVRNQEEMDAATPHLIAIDKAGWKTWLSVEPMQSEVGILFDPPEFWRDNYLLTGELPEHPLCGVVLGGQSGPNALPLNLDWVRVVEKQCDAAGVPFAFKQGAGRNPQQWPFLDGVQHKALPWTLTTK